MKLDLTIFEALSLKDKRRVVKSLKDRIRNRYNVSVAEVGHLDARQRTTIGVSMVSNDSAHIHGCFDKIVATIRSGGGASLIDFEKEIL